MMLKGHGAGVYSLGFLALISGCSGESSEDPTPTSGAATCELQSFELQSVDNFIAGETLYLPNYADSCAQAQWSMTEAPSDSSNALVLGGDGLWRFTPDQAGSYAFTEASGAIHDVQVVPWSDYAFHNLNYFASESMTMVDGTLYVANVYAPTVSVIDVATMSVSDTITTGSWPVALASVPNSTWLLVAQRGSDSLGFIDTESGRLVDALWVGDEPANLLVSADGKRAYVALATESAVAVVDLETRTLIERVGTVLDPLAMALSPDGSQLWVASHRSGQPNRFPYEPDPVENELDLQILDTTTLQSVKDVYDIGVILNRLKFAQDGSAVFMARRSNDTESLLGDPDNPSFFHEVARLDVSTGEVSSAASLSHQDSSGGFAVAVHGLAEGGGKLWVTAEGSDVVVALDPTSLEEAFRVQTPGRPRAVLSDGENVYVHGPQGFSLSKIAMDGSVVDTLTTHSDPRPQEVAGGMRYFTGAGDDYGSNWSCNSCHLDGLTDTLIWNAGPFEDYVVPRPLFWLEGAYPLGWAGYLYDVRNYAYTVNANVGIRPDTGQAVNLWQYLASVMPPPAANGLTRRDGSLSEEGERGKELYEGSAGCAGCHALPLTTNRAIFGEGYSEGPSDVPVLIGAYRHNTWMKTGISHSISESIEDMGEWTGFSLSTDDVADLERYLQEMTARDFFLLGSEPRAGAEGIGIDRPMILTFPYQISSDPANLALVDLTDDAGASVEVEVSISDDGRHLNVQPEDLDYDTSYTLTIPKAFRAKDGRPMYEESTVPFITASAPQLVVDGSYVWTVSMPAFDPENGGFNSELVSDTFVFFEATDEGNSAYVLVDFLQDLTMDERAIVDGTTLRMGHVPIPIGPSFADATALVGEFVDEDGDGIGDSATGTVTISGPGFVEENVAWKVSRPADPDVCVEGSTGNTTVTVTRGDETVISWDEGNSLGMYVTEPQAVLPTGPIGSVSNGLAYWVIEAQEFPTGFAGPVTYGIVPEGADDTSTDHSAPLGGVELEEGMCVRFSVLSTDFTYSEAIVLW